MTEFVEPPLAKPVGLLSEAIPQKKSFFCWKMSKTALTLPFVFWDSFEELF